MGVLHKTPILTDASRTRAGANGRRRHPGRARCAGAPLRSGAAAVPGAAGSPGCMRANNRVALSATMPRGRPPRSARSALRRCSVMTHPWAAAPGPHPRACLAPCVCRGTGRMRRAAAAPSSGGPATREGVATRCGWVLGVAPDPLRTAAATPGGDSRACRAALIRAARCSGIAARRRRGMSLRGADNGPAACDQDRPGSGGDPIRRIVPQAELFPSRARCAAGGRGGHHIVACDRVSLVKQIAQIKQVGLHGRWRGTPSKASRPSMASVGWR